VSYEKSLLVVQIRPLLLSSVVTQLASRVEASRLAFSHGYCCVVSLMLAVDVVPCSRMRAPEERSLISDPGNDRIFEVGIILRERYVPDSVRRSEVGCGKMRFLQSQWNHDGGDRQFRSRCVGKTDYPRTGDTTSLALSRKCPHPRRP